MSASDAASAAMTSRMQSVYDRGFSGERTMDEKTREEVAAAAVREIGLFSLKSLFALCAGAAVLSVGFAGDFLKPTGTLKTGTLMCAVVLFLLGAGCVLVSAGAAYMIAQGVSWFSEGRRGLFTMIVPAVGAYLLFVAGVILAMSSVSG